MAVSQDIQHKLERISESRRMYCLCLWHNDKQWRQSQRHKDEERAVRLWSMSIPAYRGRFKCGGRSWLCYTMNIPRDWHCVSCNCPESASPLSVSAGGDISSQGRREGRHLQTNRRPVCQTSISWSQLPLLTPLTPPGEKKHWAGANSKLQG